MIVLRPNASPVADLYRHLPLVRDDDEAKADRKLLRRMDWLEALK